MANRIYARIADGHVAEIVTLDAAIDIAHAFHPSLVFVDITGASPMPAQGWTYSQESGFAEPPAPVLSPARQMMAAMAAGLAITSTGTPAISATYHAAGDRWALMLNQAQYVATFGVFSGGLETLPWQAISGPVEFATTAQFLAIARAIGDWQTGWHLFVDGLREAGPAGSVTIA
jgi:hypothetical protein